MTIPLEIKQRIAYSYLGCEYETTFRNFTNFGVVGDDYSDSEVKNETFCILLKPLSSITDEDAIEVLALTGCWRRGELSSLEKEFKVHEGKMWVTNLELDFANIYKASSKKESAKKESGADAIIAFQYLQSKGYALPYMQYSVEDLIKSGIYKLTQ